MQKAFVKCYHHSWNHHDKSLGVAFGDIDIKTKILKLDFRISVFYLQPIYLPSPFSEVVSFFYPTSYGELTIYQQPPGALENCNTIT